MANRNRTMGNRWELEVIKRLKDIGFEKACSSRNESRQRDADGIDICFSHPYAIQCKNVQKIPNYHELMERMNLSEDEIPMVFHKYTKKANTKFVTQGKYVTMRMDDWMELVYDLLNTKDLASSTV